jgi:hypothetical protein
MKRMVSSMLERISSFVEVLREVSDYLRMLVLMQEF